MTPKEKATDLIDKFLDYAWADLELKRDEYSKSLRNSAKQCVITHVDEILKLDLVQPLMRYEMNYTTVNDYYSQVKEELLKL